MLTMFRAFMEGAFEYVSSWEVLSSNNTPTKKRKTKKKQGKGAPCLFDTRTLRNGRRARVRAMRHCCTPATLPCLSAYSALPAYSALLASFTLPCLSADAPEQQRYR